MKSCANVIVSCATDSFKHINMQKRKSAYMHWIFVSLIYETEIIRYNKFIEIEWCIYICI